MSNTKTFMRLTAAAMLCGCGDPPFLADDGENLDAYCRGTFTADYVVEDGLQVKKGESYLLSGMSYGAVMLVYEADNGAVQIFLPDDLTNVPIESPCLDESATFYTDLVTFARIDVFADDGLRQRICTLEKLDRGSATDDFALSSHGDTAYEVNLPEGFCDGQKGFVRPTTIDVQGTPWVSVPIIALEQRTN